MTSMARISSSGANSICQRREISPMIFMLAYAAGRRLIGVSACLEYESVVHFPIRRLVLELSRRGILHHIFDPAGRLLLGRFDQVFDVELAGGIGLVESVETHLGGGEWMAEAHGAG